MAEYEHVEGFVEISEVLRAGVYILMHRGTVVYVGKAKVMLGRIYSHRVRWGTSSRKRVSAVTPPKGMLFDRIFVRPCHSHEVDALEVALIAQYQPRHNIQHKSSIPPELSGIVARIVSQRGVVPQPQPRRIDRRGF